MTHLDMLQQLKDRGFVIMLETSGAVWKLFVSENAEKEELYIDYSLESLIGVVYSDYNLIK